MSKEVIVNEDAINNWWVYESYQVAIDIYRQEIDGGHVFNAHVSHVLEVDEDNQPVKAITIQTDLWDKDPVYVIKEVAKGLETMFDSIGDLVISWDENVEELERYSLTELMTKPKSKIVSLGM